MTAYVTDEQLEAVLCCLPDVKAWKSRYQRVMNLFMESDFTLMTLRTPVPKEYWSEKHGAVLWWKFPLSEPPYVGSPLDEDFPDDVTHWTVICLPCEPRP